MLGENVYKCIKERKYALKIYSVKVLFMYKQNKNNENILKSKNKTKQNILDNNTIISLSYIHTQTYTHANTH